MKHVRTNTAAILFLNRPFTPTQGGPEAWSNLQNFQYNDSIPAIPYQLFEPTKHQRFNTTEFKPSTSNTKSASQNLSPAMLSGKRTSNAIKSYGKIVSAEIPG
jgi:hypothetical protein